MAEEVARMLMAQMGIEGTASSAGVYASEGMPASIGAENAIAMAGGSLDHHHATQLTVGHLRDADIVLCMSRRHVEAVLRLDPASEEKTYTLLGYAGAEGDVEDPFGGDDDVYISTLAQIGAAIRKILEKEKAR
jgi:protein-tyrosine-phosphatase